VSGDIDVKFQTGSSSSYTVSADTAVMEYISVKVKGSTLTVQLTGNACFTGDWRSFVAIVTVTAPEFPTEVTVSGEAEFENHGGSETVDTLTVTVSGEGEATLQGVSADKCIFTVTGEGEINGPPTCDTLEVSGTGEGEIKVQLTGSATGSLSGEAELKVSGGGSTSGVRTSGEAEIDNDSGRRRRGSLIQKLGVRGAGAAKSKAAKAEKKAAKRAAKAAKSDSPCITPSGTRGNEGPTDLDDFTAIDVSGDIDVKFQTGSSSSYTVSADTAVMEYISVKVKGSTLTVQLTGNACFTGDWRSFVAIVTVTAPEFPTEVTVSGEAEFENHGGSETVDTLTVTVSGEGEATLQGVSADKCIFTVTGEGEINGPPTCDTLEVSGTGEGEIKVQLTGSATGSLSGEAELKVSGGGSTSGVRTSGEAEIDNDSRRRRR